MSPFEVRVSRAFSCFKICVPLIKWLNLTDHPFSIHSLFVELARGIMWRTRTILMVPITFVGATWFGYVRNAFVRNLMHWLLWAFCALLEIRKPRFAHQRLLFSYAHAFFCSYSLGSVSRSTKITLLRYAIAMRTMLCTDSDGPYMTCLPYVQNNSTKYWIWSKRICFRMLARSRVSSSSAIVFECIKILCFTILYTKCFLLPLLAVV